MPYKARCNGCGYDGGPNGDDWEATASSYAWGRCPKCGTTNLEVEVLCDQCGTKETAVMGTMTRCLKCYPEQKHGPAKR
jgi:Zn finger protein HypA/HybF involved in hydrogenase expression